MYEPTVPNNKTAHFALFFDVCCVLLVIHILIGVFILWNLHSKKVQTGMSLL